MADGIYHGFGVGPAFVDQRREKHVRNAVVLAAVSALAGYVFYVYGDRLSFRGRCYTAALSTGSAVVGAYQIHKLFVQPEPQLPLYNAPPPARDPINPVQSRPAPLPRELPPLPSMRKVREQITLPSILPGEAGNVAFPFDALPPEVRERIYDYLNLIDARRLAQMCRFIDGDLKLTPSVQAKRFFHKQFNELIDRYELPLNDHLAPALAWAGRLQEAEDWAKKPRNRKDKIKIYRALAVMYAQLGYDEKTVKTYATKILEFKYTVEERCHMARDMAQLGRAEIATYLIDHALKSVNPPDVSGSLLDYTKISKTLTEISPSGDLKLAAVLIKRLGGLTNSVSEMTQIRAHLELAHLHFAMDQRENFDAHLTEASRQIKKWGSGDYDYILSGILLRKAEIQHSTGDNKGALETLKEVCDLCLSVRTIQSQAAICARIFHSNRMSWETEALHTIPSEILVRHIQDKNREIATSKKVLYIRQIISSINQFGTYHQIRKIFDQWRMGDLGIVPINLALYEFQEAYRLVQRGMYEDALKLFNQAHSDMKTLRHYSKSELTLWQGKAISHALNAGKYRVAWTLWNDLLQRGYSVTNLMDEFAEAIGKL